MKLFLRNPNLLASSAVAMIIPDAEVQDIDTLSGWNAAERKSWALRV